MKACDAVIATEKKFVSINQKRVNLSKSKISSQIVIDKYLIFSIKIFNFANKKKESRIE